MAHKMRTEDFNLLKLTFVLIGMSCMFYWNAVLNSLYSIIINQFPNHTNLSTNLYTTFACLTSLYMGTRPPRRPLLWHIGGAVIVVFMSVLFPVSAIFLEDSTAGLALLYVGVLLAAVGDMTYQVTAFSAALSVDYRLGGHLSLGFGISGIMSFAIWMLLSNTLSLKLAVGLQFCVVLIVMAVSVIMLLRCLKRGLLPTFGMSISNHRIACAKCKRSDCQMSINRLSVPRGTMISEPGTNVITLHHEPISICSFEAEFATNPSIIEKTTTLMTRTWDILSRSWQCQIGIALVMFVSMMCYPNISPYMWGLTVLRSDIVTGVFQVGDVLGRYVGVLGAKTHLITPTKPIAKERMDDAAEPLSNDIDEVSQQEQDDELVETPTNPFRWLFVSKNVALTITWLRFALLALVIVIAKAAHDAGLVTGWYSSPDMSNPSDNVIGIADDGNDASGSPWLNFGLQVFIVACLALTHGWLAGIFMSRVGEKFTTSDEHSRASGLAVGLLVSFIAIGMWFATLVSF